MPGLDEFDLIKRLFAPLTGGRKEALNLTDDVALIDGPGESQWAVTVDAIVAGVHFLPDDPPEQIARKLVRVNLSDLAAKSAEPRFLLLATCFPKDVSSAWLERFAAGLRADCEAFGVGIIGGDTVATPGPLTLSLTAIGEVPKNAALLRSNARSGHSLWVSGTLGDAAFGLLVSQGRGSGLTPSDADFLRERYLLPQPRLTLGRGLRGLARAAMDISDGLLGDLGHICTASGVGAVVEADHLPRSPQALAAQAAGLGDSIALAAGGGDDYEILFTAPPEADEAILTLGGRLGLPLTRIGRIVAGAGVTLADAAGSSISVAPGFRHFSAEPR